MSTVNKSSLCGMGSVVCTGTEYRGKFESDPASLSDIGFAADALTSLLSSPETSVAAYALACSVLNTQFRQTGWLYSVSESGRVDWKSIDDKAMREAMADSLGL